MILAAAASGILGHSRNVVLVSCRSFAHCDLLLPVGLRGQREVSMQGCHGAGTQRTQRGIDGASALVVGIRSHNARSCDRLIGSIKC